METKVSFHFCSVNLADIIFEMRTIPRKKIDPILSYRIIFFLYINHHIRKVTKIPSLIKYRDDEERDFAFS